MKQKILITGSNGLLGQSLLDLFLDDENYEVIALSRGKNRYVTAKDYLYEEVDLIEKAEVRALVLKHQPNFIVNTAAMTNVDQCEDDKKTCDAINVDLVKELVNVSSTIKAHIIHISTDFIFDGKNGPYREGDKPNPVNYYGLSKLKSEQVLKKSDIDFTILRTILVYGKVHDMSRNNIVLWIRKMLLAKKEITIVNDQYRMPTYVEDLAMACKKVIEKRAAGIFNISSTQLMSIYEIAHEVARVLNLDNTFIKPISTQELNQRAARPIKTGFVLDKTIKELELQLNPFKIDLQRFKEKLT